jgi:HSP20 family molecular chaperone IbpA
MQPIEQALKELRTLHEQLNHAPAPEIGPSAFIPFPAGPDPVAFAIDEVQQLKQLMESIESVQREQPAVAQWTPRASLFAGDSCVSIAVELPGVAKEDVSVTAGSGQLTVRGERKPATCKEGLKPLMVEQPWGLFERRFPLPAWASPERITARYTQGVLEIDLTRGDDTAAGEFRVEIG